MKTLSVALTCSDPISLDFPLIECFNSVLPIADEIVLVNGDMDQTHGEVNQCMRKFNFIGSTKFDVYHLPWRDSFRKNMSLIAKTASISQCTGDYVLLLDADEVIHERDYDKISQCIEKGEDAYSFSTIHFYRDYFHYKKYGERWYNFRPKLFKNGLGIWDGYQSWIEEVGFASGIKREYTADLVTWDYKPVHEFSKRVNIQVYHYGWCRKPEVMLKKQNNIEKRHHPDYEEMKQWEWDMSNTEVFIGTHPEVMKERIANA